MALVYMIAEKMASDLHRKQQTLPSTNNMTIRTLTECQEALKMEAVSMEKCAIM
jgi:hypothetical protein